MKISHWKLGFLLVPMTVLLAACPSKKDDSRFDPNTSPFTGVWADEGAMRDFHSTGNGTDQNTFCNAVYNDPVSHGLTRNLSGPGIHAYAVRKSGEVTMYSPQFVIQNSDLNNLSPYSMGAVDKDGNFTEGAAPSQVNGRTQYSNYYGAIRIANSKLSLDDNGILTIYNYRTQLAKRFVRVDDGTITAYQAAVNECENSAGGNPGRGIRATGAEGYAPAGPGAPPTVIQEDPQGYTYPVDPGQYQGGQPPK